MDGFFFGTDNYGNTYAVFNCLTSLYLDFRSEIIPVLAQTPEAASLSETPYFNEIAHPFQIYIVGTNLVTSIVGTPEVLEAFDRLRETSVILQITPAQTIIPDVGFFNEIDVAANTVLNIEASEEASELLLAESKTQPHTQRPFSFRRYWDKIDLYGPVFAILAVTIFGLVMVLRLPTPGSNAFNSKHARDERSRLWAQKLLTKTTQINKYWLKFKNFLKKTFKVK